MTYEAWFSLARYNLYEMVNPILFIDNHRQSFKMTLRGKTHTDVDFLLSNTNCWCFRLNDYFNPSSPNGMGCKKHTDNKLQIVSVLPSLNTQSCIKGLLVVRDFCFWAIWAAGPVLKKKLVWLWATFEGGFFMFSGPKKPFSIFLKTL